MSTASATSGPAPAIAPPAPQEYRHPFFLPHFRNLWLGSSISVLGTQFNLVAMPWLVLQLTGSSLALGTILMTATIPRTALMLIGGAVTDRLSPRRVLTVTALIRALLVGTVAVLVWFKVIQIWQIYVVTFLLGVADAFSFPAGGALIPSLVAPPQLPRANSMFQSSSVLLQMIGPAPAALLIKGLGIAFGFLVDALSFLAVLAALLTIPDRPRAPRPARPGMLQFIGEGLRAVWNDPPLVALTAVFASINLCVAGATGVGLASLAKFQFGSVAVLGTLLSCFAGGTLAGALGGGLIKRPRQRGFQLIALSALAGLALLAVGVVSGLVATGALLALTGACFGLANVYFSSWAQARVDRALLGRVYSVVTLFAIGLLPVVHAISGALAQWNVRGLFLATGAVLAVFNIAMALTSKVAREID
ncbi:MAG TPA: MFS transporter [Thermoanaerobaculia bacterium]|nr:MFS transporter [Thermoanaerobaculia bacterium]